MTERPNQKAYAIADLTAEERKEMADAIEETLEEQPKDPARILAWELFPDDYSDGINCEMEVGREGQRCGYCDDLHAAWLARIEQCRAALAKTKPTDEEIDALALRMWSVHPKDLDAAGYLHTSKGGKYKNPRAAWYADQIRALIGAS